VYPHSRLIAPLFSGLLELLPNTADARPARPS
jgi:hypothetical protein